MFCNCFKWIISTLFLTAFLQPDDVIGLFVKHLHSGKCITDTGKMQSPQANYVEFTDKCFQKNAQFVFLQNGALSTMEQNGYLVPLHSWIDRRKYNMFFIYVGQTSHKILAVKQTPSSELSVFYKPDDWGGVRVKWCAVPKFNEHVFNFAKIKPYVGLSTSCNGARDKLFHFGSITCDGQKMKNTNCPKDQYMVVKTASLRGLSPQHSCGVHNDYICETDATCLMKKRCDGKHDCNIAVDRTLYPQHSCPMLTKYLYVEYQCVDKSESFNDYCVESVSLLSLSSANEGFLTMKMRKVESIVCSNALLQNEGDVVCRQLGYMGNLGIRSLVSKSKLAKFYRTIRCLGSETTLSQCEVGSSVNSCPTQAYISCKVCNNPLLQLVDYFPDSSFTASGSSGKHAPRDARITNGSSWCAPRGNHYLQVNLNGKYVISTVATFGDSKERKWTTSYYLNYTEDMIEWKQSSTNKTKIFRGTTNAFSHVAIQRLDNMIKVRALRFIPIDGVGQRCLRVEICGKSLKPGRANNVTVRNIKARTAVVSWTHPVIKTFSRITHFWIRLEGRNTTVLNVIMKLKRDENLYLSPLFPFTKYQVSISLGNDIGYGQSTIVVFTSAQAAPEGPPLNITVLALSSSSLLVKWLSPEKEKSNGIITRYFVCFSKTQSVKCQVNQTTARQELVIRNLKESTKYFIRVLASTTAGPGEYSEYIERFTCGRPATFVNGTSTMATLSLYTPMMNYTHFFIVVKKLSRDNHHPQSPDSFRNTDFVTYSDVKKSGKPYIAAVITPSNFAQNIFVLGDGRNTTYTRSPVPKSTNKAYYNVPLTPGNRYQVFQRIFIDEEEYLSTEWSTVFETISSVDGDNNPASSTGGVVGGVLSGVFLIFLIILAVILFRKYQERRENERKNNDNDVIIQNGMNTLRHNGHEHNSETSFNNDEVIFNPCLLVNDESIYGNRDAIAARSHQPIPIDEFEGYVTRMKRDGNKEFKLDFEDLPTGQTLKGNIAKKPFNVGKNRFCNAVTYDHSRVVLSGDERKDYINASYLAGHNGKYYIATQGPKPKTVKDFWRMIFEQSCPTIVMLTTLCEMGKIKCEKYWPDETASYCDIIVTVTETKTFADYVTRKFRLEKDNKTFEVQQFHFLSWPDYGLPLYPTQILTFRRHFKSYHLTRKGSVVVHCSAGVGRTGVFIAVDKILDSLHGGDSDVDVFHVVKEMRSRRANMVQTLEQYVFIHETILDCIKCGVNEVEAMHLMIEIKKLSQKNSDNLTGFEEKFLRLNKVSPRINQEKCDAALLPENKKKNRNASIYPSEFDRVYLQPITDIPNSDYINACFVDGYLGRNYYIVTQTPLNGTINDFWRMILQHNVSTMVMLNQLRENIKEYPWFWPNKRAVYVKYGSTIVVLDSVVKKDNIIVRKFIISPSRDLKEGRMIRMIQYLSWPDHDVPANADEIVTILSAVEESQRNVESKGPIVVVCSDGAGRSGTFIAISNLVDRVKVVQAIDVFQCIKLIRCRRPQFVETAAQFKLCYEAVISLLRSFDEYHNFSLVYK